jgi:trans-aconitate methyltransferase
MIDGAASPLVRAILPPQLRHANLLIADDDPMLWAGERRTFDERLVAYFQRGLEAARLVQAVAPSPSGPILDFASGWGRVTRFLIAAHKEVVASDIDESAMRYCREVLSATTVTSTREPQAFSADQSFQMILCLSLFTHLPPHLFTKWLEVLYGHLTEEGVLLITVHPERLIDARSREVDGITFSDASESTRLDPSIYGSTWVSHEYVLQAIANACAGATVQHMPYAVGNYQDAYAIMKRQRVVAYDGGPFGYFSVCKNHGRRRACRLGRPP